MRSCEVVVVLASRRDEVDLPHPRMDNLGTGHQLRRSKPGTFKDRLLVDFDPHLVLEGIAIACWA